MIQKKHLIAPKITGTENCTQQAKNDAPTTHKNAGKFNKIPGWVPSSIIQPIIQPMPKKTPKKFI